MADEPLCCPFCGSDAETDIGEGGRTFVACCNCSAKASSEVWNTRHQPNGGAGAEGWSGWATQYPGKLPKLYGDRAIAELNHHPDEGQRLLFLTTGAEDARDAALVEAYLEGNGLLRSLHAVCERVATQYATAYAGVNFGALHERLNEHLKRYQPVYVKHAAMSDQNKGKV